MRSIFRPRCNSHGLEILDKLTNRWAKEAEVEVGILSFWALLVLLSEVIILPPEQLIRVVEVDLRPLNLILQHVELVFVLCYGRVHLQLHFLPKGLASIGLLGQLLLELCFGGELLLISLGLPSHKAPSSPPHFSRSQASPYMQVKQTKIK
ncbi:hypothetical protein ACOSQ2_014337 [Xanthoceras sorbifolium]